MSDANEYVEGVHFLGLAALSGGRDLSSSLCKNALWSRGSGRRRGNSDFVAGGSEATGSDGGAGGGGGGGGGDAGGRDAAAEVEGDDADGAVLGGAFRFGDGGVGDSLVAGRSRPDSVPGRKGAAGVEVPFGPGTTSARDDREAFFLLSLERPLEPVFALPPDTAEPP